MDRRLLAWLGQTVLVILAIADYWIGSADSAILLVLIAIYFRLGNE